MANRHPFSLEFFQHEYLYRNILFIILYARALNYCLEIIENTEHNTKQHSTTEKKISNNDTLLYNL